MIEKSRIQNLSEINDYLISVSLRENEILKRLRLETAQIPQSVMQIPPEQGQFMALMVKVLQAEKALEIGTFTGYSTLWLALALPENGRLIACDINQQWAEIGKKYWQEAGVSQKIDFHLGPATQTLDSLLANGENETFDFAFIDADNISYDDYYEKSLKLLRPGGIIIIDNILLVGSVVNPVYAGVHNMYTDSPVKIKKEEIAALQKLNEKIRDDKRVDVSIIPMADGISLIRKL